MNEPRATQTNSCPTFSFRDSSSRRGTRLCLACGTEAHIVARKASTAIVSKRDGFTAVSLRHVPFVLTESRCESKLILVYEKTTQWRTVVELLVAPTIG